MSIEHPPSDEVRAKTMHLHVVDDNRLRLEQEPELGFVHPLEGSLKVFLSIAISRRGKDHQRCVRPLETHVKHPLGGDVIPLKALTPQLCADIVVKPV